MAERGVDEAAHRRQASSSTRTRSHSRSASLGGELANNLLFSGQRVLPAVLDADAGFTFQHPDLATALHALLGK